MSFSTEERIVELDKAYQRLVPVVVETRDLVKKLNDNLTGHMDEKSNTYINGYFQRVQCMEENHRRCMEKSNSRWKGIFLIAKEVIVGIILAILVYKVGLK